jgi:hypothetical protein
MFCSFSEFSIEILIVANAVESGQQWRGVSLTPAAAGFGEDLFAVDGHLCDEIAGCSGLLVFCSPDEEFEEDRGEVDAFLGQAVVDSSGIFLLGLRDEDAGGFELLQAVGEDVGGDAFA